MRLENLIAGIGLMIAIAFFGGVYIGKYNIPPIENGCYFNNIKMNCETYQALMSLKEFQDRTIENNSLKEGIDRDSIIKIIDEIEKKYKLKSFDGRIIENN